MTSFITGSVWQSTPVDLIETGKSLKVQAERPHLVSLGSGRLSTAITLLPLPEGQTPSASIQTWSLLLLSSSPIIIAVLQDFFFHHTEWRETIVCMVVLSEWTSLNSNWNLRNCFSFFSFEKPQTMSSLDTLLSLVQLLLSVFFLFKKKKQATVAPTLVCNFLFLSFFCCCCCLLLSPNTTEEVCHQKRACYILSSSAHVSWH